MKKDTGQRLHELESRVHHLEKIQGQAMDAVEKFDVLLAAVESVFPDRPALQAAVNRVAHERSQIHEAGQVQRIRQLAESRGMVSAVRVGSRSVVLCRFVDPVHGGSRAVIVDMADPSNGVLLGVELGNEAKNHTVLAAYDPK